VYALACCLPELSLEGVFTRKRAEQENSCKGKVDRILNDDKQETFVQGYLTPTERLGSPPVPLTCHQLGPFALYK